MSDGEHVLPNMPPNIALGDVLGAGGMGEVFAAQHTEHGAVVVKVMHSHLDGRNRERLRLEAEALAKISSPNVVRILDWGVADDRPYLVMERLMGHPLDVRLQSGALPVEEAVAITIDVLRGLGVVHDNKLVHRDIKPANIFICPNRAVLLDFGIVKLLENVTGMQQLANPTQAGASVGTPRYMSPEQARGKPVDPRTDFYCLGAVIFRMLTGENLFPYNDFVKQVTAHAKEPPRWPSQLVGPSVPPALDQVVVRALAKKQDERFPDAATFIAALIAAVPSLAPNLAAPDVAAADVAAADVAVPAANADWANATMMMPEGVDAPPPASATPPPKSLTARSPGAALAASNTPDEDGFVPLNPGDQCGEYTIEHEIGRGGMGIVYLAKNAAGRRRAIKTLVFGGHLAEQLVERFAREMLLLSSIESPHMVRFYDAGKLQRPEGTTMWIALEYLDGRTLREIIGENPQGVEPENVARWCRHIAEGVTAAHKIHVVHRDLKPENAALTGDTVKVYDLGIAKWQLASTSTAGNMRIGTLAYMAPEQADPSMGKIDDRTDIYALGLILHELATGRHPICPFDEPLSAMEVQLRIVGMEPPYLTELIPNFPPDLALIARRCLYKQPDERYASMREVSDALEEVLIRLRTRRHAAAFAELGVDAGAAHKAARKARTSTGPDLTPPPVVTDATGAPVSSPAHGSGPQHRVGTKPRPSTVRMQQVGGYAPTPAPFGAASPAAGSPHPASANVASPNAAALHGATPGTPTPTPGAPGGADNGYAAVSAPQPFLAATQVADLSQLAQAHRADSLVDATAPPSTEPIPSDAPRVGTPHGVSTPPGLAPYGVDATGSSLPARRGGGLKWFFAAVALLGLLGGGAFMARGKLFGISVPGSDASAQPAKTEVTSQASASEGAEPEGDAPEGDAPAGDAPEGDAASSAEASVPEPSPSASAGSAAKGASSAPSTSAQPPIPAPPTQHQPWRPPPRQRVQPPPPIPPPHDPLDKDPLL